MGTEVEKAAGLETDSEDKHGGQLTWLTNMLEPAMKLYRRALPAGMHVRLFSLLMPLVLVSVLLCFVLLFTLITITGSLMHLYTKRACEAITQT